MEVSYAKSKKTEKRLLALSIMGRRRNPPGWKEEADREELHGAHKIRSRGHGQ